MKENSETTAVSAGTGDVPGFIDRADALVGGFLAVLTGQRRSLATAVEYVLALGRDVRANCRDLAGRAGHDGGPHLFQGLLGSCRWSREDGRERLPALARDVLEDDPGDEIGPGLAIDETAASRRARRRLS